MRNIHDIIDEHIFFCKNLQKEHFEAITAMAKTVVSALQNGNTIFFMGNGGSAADSQHLAAELVGRFKKNRRAYKSISLTTDTSIITSIGNDYGYEEIFSRQLEGLSKHGDIVFALSTSGKSPNVVKAVDFAKENGLIVLGLLGKDGGVLKNKCDIEITINSEQSDRTQEIHGLIGHIICEIVEESLDE
ncbi:MAG: D-sedoheptulose-7-phosphate isomerase [Treponemataceae bacterium]